MSACPCGSERPCMSPMIKCDHPMRQTTQTARAKPAERWSDPASDPLGDLMAAIDLYKDY